jgi:hypothetical protein
MVAFINSQRDDVECVDFEELGALEALLDRVLKGGKVGALEPEPLRDCRRIILRAAMSLAVGQRDAAALLLDGVPQRLALEWFAGQDLAAPDLRCLLANLEERQSVLAWWLRLALRAPDIEARLFHCRRMLAVIDGDESRS